MKMMIWGAALLCCATPLLAQGDMGGGMGGMGSGMGGGPPPGGDGAARPPRPREMKPVRREALDKIVTTMFQLADADRDGIVTLAELRAVVQARRDETIHARFRTIDTDHDGAISPAEFLGWQRTMGSVAFSDAAAMGQRDGPIADAIRPEPGDGEEGRLLGTLIEPLNANSIAQANSNYAAGVSLEELLAYERKPFDAADANHDGYLAGDELRSLTPRGGRPGGERAGGGAPPMGDGAPPPPPGA
ncbi:EF-hand domain-containing protein [Sphingobium sp. CAP-1]|uniref:EF-hand domain-containing protein n=1 Tax=Sphingobium sp. CAP-1 TaxID=2676077 RepID=UPI0012BB48F1|nr:EF-hand domain-containing protein [Sphingobium sp. CAP-1]QGP77891.1 calcium-binding protein [Sphingobium sp. CAP-1]